MFNYYRSEYRQALIGTLFFLAATIFFATLAVNMHEHYKTCPFGHHAPNMPGTYLFSVFTLLGLGVLVPCAKGLRAAWSESVEWGFYTRTFYFNHY